MLLKKDNQAVLNSRFTSHVVTVITPNLTKKTNNNYSAAQLRKKCVHNQEFIPPLSAPPPYSWSTRYISLQLISLNMSIRIPFVASKIKNK